MHRRCIALILGMAILFCSIPVRIDQDSLAEEELTPLITATEPSIVSEPSDKSPAETPTAEPTAEPTVDPTTEPTTEPTAEPTVEPTAELMAEPTTEPTSEPTVEPASEPTVEPAVEPTTVPTSEPTSEPTAEPSPAATATSEPTAPPVYYCGIDEHVHAELCFSSNALICGLEEHRHGRKCLIKPTPAPTETAMPDTSIEPSVAPALTAAKRHETNEVFACNFEEHVHTSLCFDGEQLLICEVAEHTHSDACLADEEPLHTQSPSPAPGYACGLQEHAHAEDCYADHQELVCSLGEHIHSDACNAETNVPPTATPKPIPSENPLPAYYCGMAFHVHSAECYDASSLLICQLVEHQHTDICAYQPCTVTLTASPDQLFAAEESIISIHVAGGIAPYTISVSVTVDGKATGNEETQILEAEGVWKWNYQPTVTGVHQLAVAVTDGNGAAASAECTLTVTEPVPQLKENWTESFAHINLTGDIRSDLLAIAQTQLGYAESETDFIYVDDQPKGYTRYGAWFDAPYEDWCAMFASFCLHYAGISDEFPLSGNVPDWIDTLKTIGAYRSAGDYLPMPGDLIFFDWDADENADHVGLVAQANANAAEILLSLTTMEGNVENQVAYRQYALPEDTRIMGFGQIAENEIMTAIEAIEALIAPIPPVEEVEEIMTALSGTDEENAYLMQIVELCLTAWKAYEPLGATQQSYVSNAHLLLDLEWLWSMHTLEEFIGGTSATPVSRADDLQTVGSSSGIRFRLFNYDANINSNGHKDVFGFRGANLHDPEGDDTVINSSLDADGYVANRAKVKPLLSNGYPVFDGRGKTGDFSLGYLFGAGGNGVTAYSPSNTPLLRNSSTNLYRYDSARNAVDYDIANNRFIVRSYVERGDSTAGYGSGYADFMPFTYWNYTTSFTNRNGVEYYYDSDKELDYWFGMTMDTAFFQPKDGRIGQDEMIFSFSGDDDVWVFIDDVLVLDLGGTHGVVTGSINFQTGQIIQHLDWAGASTPSYPTTLKECFAKAGREPNGGWSADGNTFADYSKHTFKFFYLERGAGSSNCKLTFNLPTLPDESLTVTKELTSDAIDADTGSFIENSLQYAFRVMKADVAGNATDELFIQPGTAYTLLQDGAVFGTANVLEDGTFLLKAGQSAQFDEMIAKGNGSIRYVVQEIMPDELTGQYGSIEYEVSGAGGEAKTEEGPTESFTAFQTDVLSAEESQIVTYRNKVATSNLSVLKLSKEQAPGSVFPSDQLFQLQVSLGDELLPAGVAYIIEGTDEMRTVKNAGVVELHIGETATIQKGILSGTEYRITELGTADDGFNVTFSGTVSQNDSIVQLMPSSERIQGSFPLNSTVHAIATNASYDFAIEIPLAKQALHNQDRETFAFLIEQGSWEDGHWSHSADLPGTSITVTDDAVTYGSIVIGYPADANGTFFYQVSERPGDAGFLYDSTFYIVEVTVKEGQAAVTSVWKNGTETVDAISALTFVNLKTVPITIDKTVDSLPVISEGEVFDFTLRISEGGMFVFPESDVYEKIDDTSIRFSLSHAQSITIPHLPVGSTVTISETGHDGYIAFHRIGDQADESMGSVVAMNDISEHTYVSFINRGGYMLPSTGGNGTFWYTAGGLCLLTLALLLYISKRSWKESC